MEVGYSEWTECMKMRTYCPSNDYDQYWCCYSAKVELCNRCCLSVCRAFVLSCLSVCLSVSRITAKVISWFNWNWVLWLGDWAYQLQELVLMVIRCQMWILDRFFLHSITIAKSEILPDLLVFQIIAGRFWWHSAKWLHNLLGAIRQISGSEFWLIWKSGFEFRRIIFG